jgi:hypothetical protein
MRAIFTVLAALAVASIAVSADARGGYHGHDDHNHHHHHYHHHQRRDPNVPHEFQRRHPCPSTGQTTGACPGYVRDHVVPLCKGGADSADNMQWQSTAAAKAKDKTECR